METRLFDDVTEIIMPMRDKETVGEYRYMADPDIPTLVIDDSMIECVEDSYYCKCFDLLQWLKTLLN